MTRHQAVDAKGVPTTNTCTNCCKWWHDPQAQANPARRPNGDSGSGRNPQHKMHRSDPRRISIDIAIEPYDSSRRAGIAASRTHHNWKSTTGVQGPAGTTSLHQDRQQASRQQQPAAGRWRIHAICSYACCSWGHFAAGQCNISDGA